MCDAGTIVPAHGGGLFVMLTVSYEKLLLILMTLLLQLYNNTGCLFSPQYFLKLPVLFTKS